MMNNAIIVLNFFEVINCFKKEPEYDNEAYHVGDCEDDIHFCFDLNCLIDFCLIVFY